MNPFRKARPVERGPRPSDLDALVLALMSDTTTERAALASRLRRLACQVDKPIRGKREADRLREAQNMMRDV